MIIDCRGLRCPLPILVLARRIGEVEIGATVQVEAEDPAAGGDIRAWCRMRGHDYVDTARADDGTPQYRVRRLY